MAVHKFWLFLLASARGDHDPLPVFSCDRHTDCSVDLAGLNVSDGDSVVFDEAQDGACPRCLSTDLGTCPFLRMTSGIPGGVFCEDGTVSFRWSCAEEGKGERLLCPPNHTMCAGRLCGGGADHCCMARDPSGIADCSGHGGWRRCPFQRVQNMQIGRTRNIGPQNSGKHLFCKCTEEDFMRNATATPLGELEIIGPDHFQLTTCTLGTPYCEFFLRNSYGVRPQTTMLQVTPLPCDLVHATPPDFRKHFRTGWQPDLGGVYFTNRTDMAMRDPGIYSLCWCENSTEGACESLEDYNLSAGGLVLAGPVRERKTIHAQFGEEFTVSVHMVLVTGESQLRLQSSCTEGAEVYAQAVSLERNRWGEVSDEKNFSFGELQENERMPAGAYKLCWCRVSYSYSPQLLCEDRDFITAVGDVVIRCPEHFWSSSGGSCRPCAWFWEVPNESRDGCKFDFLNTLAILAIFTYIFFGCAMFCYQLEVHISNKGFKFPIRGRKIAIEDVSSKPSSVEDEKHVIVTTVGEHKLSKRLGTIPIMFRRTELFGMEKGANGEDLWFRLKYHSKRSFQLLSLSGEPVQRESAETSHGWIILSAHRSLLHSNTWFGIPVVIIGSLLIICGIPLLLYSSDRLRIPIDGGVVVVTWLITFILAFGGSQMIKMAETTRNTISDKIDRFKSKVYRVNPTPHACKRGAGRALNINQIVDLYEEFKSFIQDRNLYYVDSNIVRPLTKSCHLSLAEFMGPSTVDWFVSHYWGTNFSYTVRALKLHANSVGRDSLITQSQITIASGEASKSIAATSSPVSRASDWKSPGSISYWICAFSNNQYRIDEELGTSHEDSSFYLALHSEWVVGTVMVLDEQALPLTRSWCLFELLQTMNLERQRPNFHGLRFATNTGVLNLGQSTTEVAMNIGKKLSSLSLENASATREQDRTQIQELILKERKSWDGINGELRKHIKEALGVCRDHVDRSFQDIFHKLEHGSNNQVSMREASL